MDDQDYSDFNSDTLEGWVIDKVDTWESHYVTNYQKKHEEYYRLWRGTVAYTHLRAHETDS